VLLLHSALMKQLVAIEVSAMRSRHSYHACMCYAYGSAAHNHALLLSMSLVLTHTAPTAVRREKMVEQVWEEKHKAVRLENIAAQKI
jgi:hypothetical protein